MEKRLPAIENGLFVRWGGQRNRADDVAESLGVPLVALRWHTRRPWLVPLRYAVQFVQTFLVLRRRRPSVVISHHTQPFGSLAAWLYCRLTGAHLVTDCHNGAFVDPPWCRWPLSALARFVFARARVNLVHNHAIAEHVREDLRIPGEFSVLRGPIVERRPEPIELPGGYRGHVLAIYSWGSDEPVEPLLEAAERLPDVLFHVTGSLRRMPEDLRSSRLANVRRTGFLPDEQYDRMLASVDLAMALSTWRYVITQSSAEAVGAGTPFLTTDVPIARRYFRQGFVFVENTGESVAAGIDEALRRREELRAGIAETRRDWQRESRLQAAALVARLRDSPGS